MRPMAVNILSLLLSVVVLGIAGKKWNIIRDRRQILTVIKNALKERKALISGIITALFYLAVFIVLGGKGGRIHVLFGRVIWNTTFLDMLTGFLLAMLLMISMALFVFGVRVSGAMQSGKESGMGFFGSLLALLAAFCPWWLPVLSALGGAAGALFLSFWDVLAIFSAAILILSILYTATKLKASKGWGWPSTLS